MLDNILFVTTNCKLAMTLSSTWCHFLFSVFFGLSSIASKKFLILKMATDDTYFQSELGWSVRGSLGWTKTVGGLNWRMPDRLGCDKVAATLICGL